jgi:serine/threonine protein kinase
MHASVYKCFKLEDLQGINPFAVKVTREDDVEKRVASLQEFEIGKSLFHPNLIKMHELFENHITGEIYQVMEYINGDEVLDLIAKQE